ncbi:hypothetical protein OEB99_00275 [Actinotalea sp. M2MS4P-6]|uniref:hypothetical protein n=1 Tax=Actinotalea sp. M2MS4P-6 TaxID=2983762 RepID=UPI0021E46441|nr:hypothetical protein [Actinotalea sp. M2MS4P-6]MCV2392733.1 hypothetical protein [Actinotalea sp. M2MS4P-6]
MSGLQFVGALLALVSVPFSCALAWRGTESFHLGAPDYWRRGAKWGPVAGAIGAFSAVLAVFGVVSVAAHWPEGSSLNAPVAWSAASEIVFAMGYLAALRLVRARPRRLFLGRLVVYEAGPPSRRHIAPATWALVAGTLLLTASLFLW